jgi:hypothetical protein
MSAPFITTIVWGGIPIQVSHVENWCDTDMDHIEVHVEGDARIPITDTGYRSHFVHRSSIREYGGADEYVLAWLDDTAQSRAWRAYVEASRQLTLF